MIRKQTLPTGVRLLTETMPDVRSVSIGVWLNRGSRHEPPRLNGISHFIEHLVFKGTSTRSAREIALQMDSVGGQLDAFTSKEYTCFYAKVLDLHVDSAIDLLADIVQDPLFDATELERERQVVLEEIRMVEDTPDELLYDEFSSHFYPKHALGRPIQGTAETVRAMSRRQLRNFFRGVYRPANMLIAVAGNVDRRAVSSRIRKAFRDLPVGKASGGRSSRPRSRSGLIAIERRQLGQLHLLMGVPAFTDDEERRFPLHVMSTVLGGTMSSRLFQRIREERGLAYAVYSSVNGFVDAGFLAIYAATHPDSGSEVVSIVREELRDLRDRGPGEDEVRVAKEHLKGSLMLSLESTSSRMANLARQEIYRGRQETLAQTLRKLDRVKAKDVQSVAQELFSDVELAVASVGKVRRLKLKPEALHL